MSTAVLHYSAAAKSDRGRKRSSNEDAFGYSAEHGVYLVCDGMGGAAAGEVASQQAVESALAVLCKTSPDTEVLSLENSAEQAVVAANESIYHRARRNPRFSGMGTTLVGLLTGSDRILIFNVGDSRCYRLRADALEQITLDHSLVEEQVRMGRMTPSEAERSPLRNVITRALGTQIAVTPDLFPLEAAEGDLYLLCSDGLTRELDNTRIEALLRAGGEVEELAQALVDAANQAGGHDNITCIVVRAEA